MDVDMSVLLKNLYSVDTAYPWSPNDLHEKEEGFGI